MEAITTMLDDPKHKENFIFLVLGIMVGVFLTILRHYMCDFPDKGKKTKTQSSEEGEEDDEWEDEDEESDDEGASNANEEQSPAKDKALLDKYPIDDVKMMLAVRTDLGMTKGKIGAQCGHATLGAYHTTKKWAQKSSYWRKAL